MRNKIRRQIKTGPEPGHVFFCVRPDESIEIVIDRARALEIATLFVDWLGSVPRRVDLKLPGLPTQFDDGCLPHYWLTFYGSEVFAAWSESFKHWKLLHRELRRLKKNPELAWHACGVRLQ